MHMFRTTKISRHVKIIADLWCKVWTFESKTVNSIVRNMPTLVEDDGKDKDEERAPDPNIYSPPESRLGTQHGISGQ